MMTPLVVLASTAACTNEAEAHKESRGDFVCFAGRSGSELCKLVLCRHHAGQSALGHADSPSDLAPLYSR